MEAATTEQDHPPVEGVSSFAKSLFLGEIHEEIVFPYPLPDPAEQDKIRALTTSLREWAEDYDPYEVEEKRWSDIYAQIAVLSRVSSIYAEHGVEPSGQEHYIAETFCTRAAARVNAQLDQVEHNDDERMIAISKLAYKRGEYGYAFFED